MRTATVHGGPLDGRTLEVQARWIRQALWPFIRLEGEHEDGTPRVGCQEWVYELHGDRYDLIAEPVRRGSQRL